MAPGWASVGIDASRLPEFGWACATMMTPMDLHIGLCLRHRRWLEGLTQVELAKAIGVRFQQIQKYESGANRVSASRLWDLACALNVPVSYFYVGLGEPHRNLSGLSEETLQQKETMDLLRAYYAMDEGPRRRFFELAQAASKPESRRSSGTEILAFSDSRSAA